MVSRLSIGREGVVHQEGRSCRLRIDSPLGKTRCLGTRSESLSNEREIA